MKNPQMFLSGIVTLCVCICTVMLIYGIYLITTIQMPTAAQGYKINYAEWVKVCGKGNVQETGVNPFGYQQFSCKELPGK